MYLFSRKLNDDQLHELAKLCFDLAKAAFVVAILPTFNASNNFFSTIFITLLGLFWGLAFASLGLVFLERKGKIKK